MIVIFTLLLGLNNWSGKNSTQFFTNDTSFTNQHLSYDIPSLKVTSIKSYNASGPISITNDIDLNDSFPGIGTIDDPIRIEGYNITESSGHLISISDTTFHFRIADCFLNGLTTNDMSIVFDNVVNATIKNNSIMNTGVDGIGLYYSKNNSIINNTISNASGNGIRLESLSNLNLVSNNTIFDNSGAGAWIGNSSNNNTISNNTIYQNDNGILLCTDGSPPATGSDNNTIIDNKIHNNEYSGIHLADESENNLLMNNLLYENDGYGGISLFESDNNTIKRNTLLNNNVGIRNENSSHNLIEENTIYNNTWHGIFCRYINYTTIFQNTVYNSNTSGIFLRYGHHATIANNICYRNSMIIQPIDNDLQSAGITVAVHQAFVFNNSVFKNNDNGIIVFGAKDTNISRNIIRGNRRHGISIGYSTKSLFENNQVYDNNGTGFLSGSLSNESSLILNLVFNNVEWGLEITEESHTNTINYNDFLNNNAGGIQVTDDGSTNTFGQNYWSDWSGTGSYTIDGIAGNHDSSPLTNPYHLLMPIITNISAETLTLNGNVIIEWNASKDTFGHSFTYSILYSPDNGQSWTTIASSLTTTNYTIDTTTIPDATEILLKVQAVDSIGFIAQTIYSETFLVLNNLSQPIVVSPNGGETLNETVIIEWEGSLDPSDHSITYSVYYSSDNGITWTLLASDLTSTSYSWDTNSVPNGLSYLIKVTATCSEGETSEDISDSTFTIQNSTGVPGMTLLMVLLALGIMITIRKSKKR